MADIKQINLAGTTYNLVDDTAVHSVSVSSSQSSGTEIGTITVDGTTTIFKGDFQKSPLIGNTNNTTPSQVATALANGQDVFIETTQNFLGFNETFLFKMNAYGKNVSRLVLGSGIFKYINSLYAIKLEGATQSDTWNWSVTEVAKASDIPSEISQLNNDTGYITLSDVPTVSAAASLATGVTIGTITIDGTTTTFYAPDGSKDYYIEATVSTIPTQEGTFATVTLTNGDTYSDLQQRYSSGQTLYVKLTDLSTNNVYILSLNENSNLGTLSFISDFPIPLSFPVIHEVLTVDISYRTMSGSIVTQSLLSFSKLDKVGQEAAITTAGSYPVMLGGTTATTAITSTLNKTDSLVYNPSTKLLFTGAIGVTENIGWTDTTPTTTTGYTNGQIMFVVFNDED